MNCRSWAIGPTKGVLQSTVSRPQHHVRTVGRASLDSAFHGAQSVAEASWQTYSKTGIQGMQQDYHHTHLSEHEAIKYKL